MGIYPYDSTMAALALLELKALVGVLVVIRELSFYHMATHRKLVDLYKSFLGFGFVQPEVPSSIIVFCR